MKNPSKTSPCVGICRVEGGSCVGYLRTLEEIVNWIGLDRESRLKIMKNLESRKNVLVLPVEALR